MIQPGRSKLKITLAQWYTFPAWWCYTQWCRPKVSRLHNKSQAIFYLQLEIVKPRHSSYTLHDKAMAREHGNTGTEVNGANKLTQWCAHRVITTIEVVLPSKVPVARVAVGIILPLVFISSNLDMRVASLLDGRFCLRWRSILTFSPTCLEIIDIISFISKLTLSDFLFCLSV